MNPVAPLDQFDFHHTLMETSQPSLVLFTAEGCGACRYWLRLLETAGTALGRINIFQVDAHHDAALIQEFEIRHLPTLLLFNNGEFHAHIKCEPRIENLTRAIDQALQCPAAEAP